MSITKKIRFEVFKRDKFTCQYCGQQAPDVTLQVDHIEPKSAGGSDDILNLVTSCFDCNQGKKHRRLSDNDAIKKRKKQLDDLQERREQLEMLMEWHKSLIDLEGETITRLSDLWSELASGYRLNDHGLDNLKRWVKRFGLNETVEAMKASVDQYLRYDNESERPDIATKESVEKAFNYIPRICANKDRFEQAPYLKDLYYIRGILRNRLSYVNDHKSIQLMEAALKAGIDIDEIKEYAKQVKNWSSFQDTLQLWIEESQAESAQ